jgi:hypothetical protein
MSGDLQIITKSRLAVFNLCQRLHDIQYNQGYRSLAPREFADFGLAFHAGLDAWFDAWKMDEGMLALGLAIAAIDTYVATSAPHFDPFQLAKAEVLMAAYDARWAPTMGDWDVLGVEVEFIATIPGRKRLRVAGKLDKVLRRRSDGTTWFVEHKTTGADLSEGSTYWQRLRMDPQVSIYHRGGKEIGHDFAGCLYDVVDRPAQRGLKATPVELRKYTKATKTEPSRLYAKQRETDETVAEFKDRLVAAIGEHPELYFARSEIVRLESELLASDQDVEETALQIRAGAQTGVAPRNPAGCFQFNRPCEFLGPCSGVESLDDETKFRRVIVQHEELSLHLQRTPERGG